MSNFDRGKPSIVVCSPRDGFQKQVALAQALAHALGLSAETTSEQIPATQLPVLAFGFDAVQARSMARHTQALLAFVDTRCPPVSRQRVQFRKTQLVPDVLRGRGIDEQDFASAPCLDALDEEERHGWVDSDPIWVSGNTETSTYQLVAGGFAELHSGQALCEVVRPNRLASLVPLIGFFMALRRLAGWHASSLKASFMFDDPNLHAGRYGYMCFRDIIAEAVQHKYHVSLATVPIDAWYVHEPTARLLRANQSAISLLIHGNSHTKEELARLDGERNRLATLAQSLSRIEGLERRSGLRVARVMAAPHGACAEELVNDMRRVGFEAACISSGSLRLYNQSRHWSAEIGVQPADFVCGLPVIPRFRLSKRCHNQVLLAALLRQPLIMVGHHWDLADGLGLLAELAAFVNSLGDVRWMDMTGICRSNFVVAKIGGQMIIETFSNRITVALECDQERLLVQRRDKSQPLTIVSERVGSAIDSHQGNGCNQISLDGSLRREVRIVEDDELDYRAIELPRPRMWPLVRRLLVELRDRTHPLAQAVLAKRL